MLLPVLIASLLFMLMLVRLWKISKGKGKAFSGPTQLPIKRNLHHLTGGRPHHAVIRICKKFGPVMKLQLGEVAVVISSPEASKEVFKMKEISFVQRPEVYAVEVMSYHHSIMVFVPYNYCWRQLRKISVEELLSTKCVQSFKSISVEDIWDLVEFISAPLVSLINLSDIIFTLTNNVVSRATFRKRCKDQHDFTSPLRQAVRLAGGFNIADLYPSLTSLP